MSSEEGRRAKGGGGFCQKKTPSCVSQSTGHGRKGSVTFRAPAKGTLLTPGGKASSEGPNFCDFGDPGAAEHSSCGPPGWPRGRGPGGRNSCISRGPRNSSGGGGRRPQEGCHVAAPGSPVAGGHGQGDSWPLQRAGPPGRRCPSTGQQIPPGWQDGASGSAHRSGSEGWDGVRKRGSAGEDGAGHSS